MRCSVEEYTQKLEARESDVLNHSFQKSPIRPRACHAFLKPDLARMVYDYCKRS